MSSITFRRALLSVSDKTGLVELAQTLHAHQVELISTGGTYQTLLQAGLPVQEVAEVTGFPEILEGRVKTLHPKIHGGILCRRDMADDLATMSAYGISPIDLVVVNLYPFESTVNKPGISLAEAIEQMDIGGPTLLRAAAKNHAHVLVLSDPSQYADFLRQLEEFAGVLPVSIARNYAIQAIQRTASYDAAIARYLESIHESMRPGEQTENQRDRDFPPICPLHYTLVGPLRYGENPHQAAALYRDRANRGLSVVDATVLHGKELSYNNYLDLDTALRIVSDLEEPAVVLLKHNNPCGAAVSDSLELAFQAAYAGDPLSAFGSVVGLNRPVDEATALAMCEPNRFIEAILAPDFAPAALELLTTRPTWRNSVRLLRTGTWPSTSRLERIPENRPILGGMLRQLPDTGEDGFADRRHVTQTAVPAARLADLAFAWRLVKHVRSNAIVLVQNRALVGVGAGQMSRVDATKIACEKAGARAQDAVLASDAFFPFRDGVDLAAAAGVCAIIQPGGSKRDDEVIAACDEHGIAMLFTSQRHFRH